MLRFAKKIVQGMYRALSFVLVLKRDLEKKIEDLDVNGTSSDVG